MTGLGLRTYAEALTQFAVDEDDARLSGIARRAAAPLSVGVHGRAGVGRGTVRRALAAAGVTISDQGSGSADVDLYVVADVVKPEDRAAIMASTSPCLVVLNKADLSGFAQARRRCARFRAVTGVPVVPMAAHLALADLDDELVAALRALAVEPADMRSTDHFTAGHHSVPAGVRDRLLATLGLFGISRAVRELCATPGADSAVLGRVLRRHSGIDGLVEAVHAVAAPVYYSRIRSASAALEALAATADARLAERVQHFLCCDDTVIARMEAALDVVKADGLPFDGAGSGAQEVDGAGSVAQAHLRRAAQSQRLSRQTEHPVHRLCGVDITRGSLRLWRRTTEGVR